MSPILYLATPLPLAVMILVIIAVWRLRRISIFKWLLACWVALNAFGYWWIQYDAARAFAEGHLVIDAGFTNSLNCALFGFIGAAIWLVAWLNLRAKLDSKGQQ